MSIFYVLICVISLALQSPVSLNIYNWCQDIYLASPAYFIHGGKLHATPDHGIDVNAVMRNGIEFDSGHNILEGVLAYKIQRKHTESIQDESKQTWLLVALNGEHTKGLYVYTLLVEHNKRLDEDRLRKQYQKHWSLLKARANTTKSNWVLDNATMLKMTIKTTNEGYRWDIFISEERK
jgi:hypothetical protein